VVGCAAVFPNQPPAFGALDEAYHGIVALLQEFSEFADGGPAAPCKPCDSEEELMLLGRQPARPRSLFAEAQESPELVSEGGKMSQTEVVGLSDG